jgi:hypothetical protein
MSFFLLNSKIKVEQFIKILDKNDFNLIKKKINKLKDINETFKFKNEIVRCDEMTLLIYSIIINNDIDIIKLLIENGADILQRDERKNDAIIYAALYSNNANIIKLLVDYGADINSKNIISATPIIVALENSNIEILKEIIKLNANINHQNNGGWTALMSVALSNKSIELAKILIDNGADISLKNKINKTALDIAKENNNIELINFLENFK